jgi:UDP-N-acetylmuramate dehydrogenase
VSASVERAREILRGGAHGRVTDEAPLAPLTSYQLGGPAALLLTAESADDLLALGAAVRETRLPVLVVGRGSNMLVSDRGFEGIAVRLGAGFRWIAAEGTRISAGAAVPVPGIAQAALDEDLTGFEFAVAIPASFGGAVRMNAGAHGHTVGEALESAEAFLMDEPSLRRFDAKELTFTYRASSFPPGAIVTAATIALHPGARAEIAARMREAREWRRATQPLNLPNAGSVFKNPPGDAAGRLIERVCGKRMRVGGARISEVHANFIVAEAGARADDVYTLMRRIQRRVAEETGIELEPEVKLIGRFEEVEDGASAR